MKTTHKLLIALGVVLSLSFMLFGFVNQTRNACIDHETGLSAQFQSEQAWLAQFTNGFYEQYSILGEESEVVNDILSSAVGGRYGEDGFSADGAFFAAVTEAYPELSLVQLMDNWSDISNYVAAGREEYARLQAKRLDMARSYNAWLYKGLVRSAVVRTLGYPSRYLKARVGEVEYTGYQALAIMERAITNAETDVAYLTGNHEAMIGNEGD